MNVLLFGAHAQDIKTLVQQAGFAIVENNPHYIISYGGDGTLIHAEHAFPGIPKILLKGSRVCKKCSSLSNEAVLERIKKGHFITEFLPKLSITYKQKKLLAFNDVIVHNSDPRHAIRYRLWINNSPVGDEIIGDGVIIATPFGSTGYYKSITRSTFSLGIGVAFNNSTEVLSHEVVAHDSLIQIRIVRGPAIVYADNQKDFLTIHNEEELLITGAPPQHIARIIVPEQ